MTPIEYLDACKRQIGIKSDYELARRLEWNKQGISNVRKGQRSLPSEIAYRMADILGLAHSVVWADIEAHQEKDPKKRAYWEEFLARAAVIVLTVGIGSMTLPNNAQSAPLNAVQGESVLCKIIR
jgi:plasmid maintenance system antidote protein VapI